jgi:hypothetical protein
MPVAAPCVKTMKQVEGNFLTEYLTAGYSRRTMCDKLDQSLTHLFVSLVVPVTDLNKVYTSQSLYFTLQVDETTVYT